MVDGRLGPIVGRCYRVRSKLKLGLARRAPLLERAWIRPRRTGSGWGRWAHGATAMAGSHHGAGHDWHRLDLVIHDVLEAQVNGLYPNLALDLPPGLEGHRRRAQGTICNATVEYGSQCFLAFSG